MDSAYLSAIAALSGSAIGALASVTTTWLTQHHQDRAQRSAQEYARREKMFGEFIDTASKLYAEALTHSFEDPAKLVPIYAIVNKLRLFCAPATVASADEVMQMLVTTFYSPNRDFAAMPGDVQESSDFLKAFTVCCRKELQG